MSETKMHELLVAFLIGFQAPKPNRIKAAQEGADFLAELIEQRIREARAEALRHAADDPRWDRAEHRHVSQWLRDQADTQGSPADDQA